MILLLGDSHAQPIAGALASVEGKDLKSRLKARYGAATAMMIRSGAGFHSRFFHIDGDAIYLKNSVPDRMEKFLGPDGAIRPDDGNVYGFSFGFHSAIMLRQEYWKNFTILPDVTGKDYISKGVFEQIVLDENRHILKFARALKKRGLQFFFIGAPPLRRAMLDRQVELASASELIAIKQTYQNIMATAFDQIGVSYILPPAETMENSVLKAEYDSVRELDVHHGNAHFGRVMLRAFLDTIESPQEKPVLSQAV